jgi:hypothetical protein
MFPQLVNGKLFVPFSSPKTGSAGMPGKSCLLLIQIMRGCVLSLPKYKPGLQYQPIRRRQTRFRRGCACRPSCLQPEESQIPMNSRSLPRRKKPTIEDIRRSPERISRKDGPFGGYEMIEQ